MNNNSEQMEETGASRSPRELGIIEKLCVSYGFVYCCHRDGRYFFHFSEYKNDIQQAKIGGRLSTFLSPRRYHLLSSRCGGIRNNY